MSDETGATRFTAFRLLVLFLVTVFLLSPGVMYSMTGFGTQPALEVDQPIDSVSEDETVVGYESLSSSSQDAFREASGHRKAMLDEPFPAAEYVRLDGQYYPIEETQMLPTSLLVLFLMSGIAGGLLLPILVVGIYKNSRSLQRAFDYFKRGVAYIDPGPVVVSGIAVLLLLAGFWMLSQQEVVIELSRQPVQNPQLANASVLHIQDLTSSVQVDVRDAITSGTTRPAGELTYDSLYAVSKPLETAPPRIQTFAAADYIRTDGELFRVRVVENSLSPLYYVIIGINAIGAGVVTYIVHCLTIGDIDDS